MVKDTQVKANFIGAIILASILQVAHYRVYPFIVNCFGSEVVSSTAALPLLAVALPDIIYTVTIGSVISFVCWRRHSYFLLMVAGAYLFSQIAWQLSTNSWHAEDWLGYLFVWMSVFGTVIGYCASILLAYILTLKFRR